MTIGKNCNLTKHPLGDNLNINNYELPICLLAITSASSTHAGRQSLVDVPLGTRKLGLAPLATV